MTHTPSREEVTTGKYMVSDSEVSTALQVLEMYAKQVKEHRGSLYWDAKAKGNEPFADIHLKKYQAANYIEMSLGDLRLWYNQSK